MIDVFILAIALSMDALAVSIGLGAKHNNRTLSLGFMCAAYFGVFQGIMPLIGYLGGRGVLSWVDSYAPLIAFILLLFIGIKMIYESFQEGIEEDISKVTHRIMLTLAIATSIDAMAAGFSLTVLNLNPFISSFIIGCVTFLFSWLGVMIGAKSGNYLESKAELLGGGTIILIGIKILLF